MTPDSATLRHDATELLAAHSHVNPSDRPLPQAPQAASPNSGERRQRPPETFQLYRLYLSRQWATLSLDDLAILRDQMVAAAVEHPDDTLSPELLQAAAELSVGLGEPAVAERLLRDALAHPKIGPTSRIFALHGAAMLAWNRQDVVQMFEDLNGLLDQIRELPPDLRSGYAPWYETVTGLKALALRQLLEQGEAIPEDLPPPDRGRTASDYYADLLRSPSSTAASDSGIPASWTLRVNYAVSLALEGRREDAIAVYDRVLDDATREPARFSPSWRGLQPQDSVPLVWVLSVARALDPQRGDDYVSFLRAELARGRVSEREQAALALAVASAEFEQGRARPFIQTVEPWFTGESPSVYEWLQEDPPQFGRLMAQLGHAYESPDVADPARAASWYAAYASLDDAYLSTDILRDVLVRLARIYDHGPLHDPEQALHWYRRYLELFDDDDDFSDSARDAITRLLAESGSVNVKEGERP